MKASKIQRCALQLKNANPRAFDDMIAALEERTGHALLAMSDAPQDAVFFAQGGARAWRSVLREFSECHLAKEAEKPPAADNPPPAA